MSEFDGPCKGAEAIVRGLRDLGVRFVFGYPGGPLTPIYDALRREPAIRHVLARDEQAAVFMADGYARATGDTGVCLAVCGPGVYNAATPLATAYTDSVPILLISGQVPFAARGLRSGYYHENSQLEACATLTKWRACAEKAQSIPQLLEKGFNTTNDQRPGPCVLEIPIDVLESELQGAPTPSMPTSLVPRSAAPADIDAVARLLKSWQKPVILAGGGVVHSRAEKLVLQIAERIGAPIFHTLMGKGIVPSDHPLSAGLPWHRITSDASQMASFFSPLLSECDGMLAVGCRFSQLTTGSWSMPKVPALIQIDIDQSEIGRHYPVTLGIKADARPVLRQLVNALPVEQRPPWASSQRPQSSFRLPGIDLVAPLRRALPRDAIVVADVTRLAYILMADFPVYAPRTFLHPAGFVAMAYGIPAAIGAKIAYPDRTVVAVVGDGCFMMSGMELATAVQEKLPIVIILINDSSLSLIKSTQDRRFEGRHIAVDLRNPDFEQFAKAFGVQYWRTDTDDDFERALCQAIAGDAPALIEVRIAS